MDFSKRPLRRIFLDIILATWGRGQEINVFRIPEKGRGGADFARQLRRRNKLLRAETLFQSGTTRSQFTVANQLQPGIPADARKAARGAQ
jgi:hypothetical protein